jgi:cell division protein ZipA
VAAELRWILLALCVPLLAAIWWWTARRSGQAAGNAELRESTPPPDSRYADSNDEDMRAQPKPRDWGVPPFEPLNIRTAEFEHVPVLAGSISINADPAPFTDSDPDPAPLPAAAPAAVTGPAGVVTAPAATSAASPTAHSAELQKIVTIRVCAVGEAHWSGSQLKAALEQHGLAFGRYQVFHRKHADGRSLFCVASLVEPGTFDLAEMADQEFRGVTLFAVLPGPMAPLETLDELVTTARGLAEELSGMVQDSKGMPLSPQRAAAIASDIARFQASLSMS